ncbi:MAG: class I SAM-dependent methyltransferase [Clostridia bacterium]|nr:class I SAM-dependent methyltransferase [Clostridia bacterium]
MQVNNLNWTFNTVADTYEKLRPGYVDELYQTIFEYKAIDGKSKVIEVGIGGGQATLPFLKTGCNLNAVDYGENFCKICREKFKEYPNFSAVSGKFEDIELLGEYDLIYSASAFHWIPEEIGYRKVYAMLKNGGVFCRFANHPYRDKGKPELSAEMDKIYSEYYYKYHNKEPKPLAEYTEQQARDRALIAEKYGFTDVQYKLFYRTRTFSAEEYIMLLGTYSDHIAIEEKIRKKFFFEIENAINRHGGEITIYDTIDLQLARKQCY